MSTPAAWQSHHIFYTAQSRPLLTECVGPLVRRLRERGLVHRYFFINYWLEGPHVRLRIQPASDAVSEQVRLETVQAVTAFLARRPALYSVQGRLLRGHAEHPARPRVQRRREAALPR